MSCLLFILNCYVVVCTQGEAGAGQDLRRATARRRHRASATPPRSGQTLPAESIISKVRLGAVAAVHRGYQVSVRWKFMWSLSSRLVKFVAIWMLRRCSLFTFAITVAVNADWTTSKLTTSDRIVCCKRRGLPFWVTLLLCARNGTEESIARRPWPRHITGLLLIAISLVFWR